MKSLRAFTFSASCPWNGGLRVGSIADVAASGGGRCAQPSHLLSGCGGGLFLAFDRGVFVGLLADGGELIGNVDPRELMRELLLLS